MQNVFDEDPLDSFGAKRTFISPHEAIVTLFFFGAEGNWYAPGGFEAKLLSALAHADLNNQEKIGLGFPGLTAAVQIAQLQSDGLDTLRDIAVGINRK